LAVLVATPAALLPALSGRSAAHAACGDASCDGFETAASCAADCASPASNDAAQCPADLPACSATVTECCQRPFAPLGQHRALVIPLDRCHQKVANGGSFAPPGLAAPAWCSQLGTSHDNGMMHAYGLVYRLMQRGIPVYWLINPTKDPQARAGHTARDVDLWLLSPDATAPPAPSAPLTACPAISCGAAAYRLDPSDLTNPAARYEYQQFPIRGSAFLIAPDDRVAFNAFWTTEVVPAPADTAYDFRQVDLYELPPGAWLAYQEFHKPLGATWEAITGAPVAMRLDYAPPRIAKLSGGPSDAWLAAAKLNQRATNPDCLTAPFVPSDAVFCDITKAQVGAGRLNTADIDWAWMDAGGFSCADVAQFATFMTAHGGRPGKNILFMEASISDVEACPGQEVMGARGGLATKSSAVAGPYIQRFPANVLTQWGDLPADFAQGAVCGWYSNGSGAGYAPKGTLVRLATKDTGSDCANNKSTTACDTLADDIDLLAYARHDDRPENGLAVYAPGNNLTQAGNRAHLRSVFNAMIAMPETSGSVGRATTIDIARATPIVATLDGGASVVLQGSFDYTTPPPPRPSYAGAADDASFVFPYTLGHFRAIETEDVGETATDFDALPPLFDAAAAGVIPTADPAGCGAAAFSASCRTVFTHVATGANPARVVFDHTNAAALQPLLQGTAALTLPEVESLIARVLAGVPDGSGGYRSALGGIDRSTPALIGASPLAGQDRPTMAYVGALDGMVHALCAEVTGACSYLGQELWAFVPRTQLGQLRQNTQRIDGSPRVADVFGDFDGDGDREWKTVLVVATGSGDASVANAAPALIGLDISDPADPGILWEVTTAGPALGTTLGPVRVGAVSKYLAIASTSRGAGAPGVVTYAVDAVTGAVEWRRDTRYAAARDAANPAVPSTGIPATPSLVDLDGSGQFTHAVVPSLYGSVWLLRAADGGNPYGGATPLFAFGADFRPIGASASVYRDAAGRLHAIVGSGGYVDTLGITGWSPASESQYLVAFSLETAPVAAPLDETTVGPDLAFVDDLGAGNRVFAAPSIAGNELFVVTDSEDINDLTTFGVTTGSGTLRRYSLTTGAEKAPAITLARGGSSVDGQGAAVYATVATAAQKVDLGTASFDSVGRSAELDDGPDFRRLLYLRTQ
jgi:hypothetical protein